MFSGARARMHDRVSDRPLMACLFTPVGQALVEGHPPERALLVQNVY